MKQYIPKAALVAEIEKRKQTWQHQDQQYTNGGKDVCDYLLGFLNTLEVKEVQEEPVSEELEEAAKKIATRHSHITGDTYYANDAWFFKKGAQWQKEQMMKDAVYGLVCGHDESSPAWIDLNLLNKPNIKVGTEVKLIIIKNE